MDSAPQEVIQNILSFIPQKRVAWLSSVSFKWQHAIERRTFKTLRITNDAEDLEGLESILFPATPTPSSTRRLSYLRRIYFDVILDINEIPAKEFWQRERQGERQVDRFNEPVAAAIRSLFQVLKNGNVPLEGDREHAAQYRPNLDLWVCNVLSKLDKPHVPGEPDENRYLRERICPALTTAGGEHQGLPTVACVSQLHFAAELWKRALALRTAADLSARLSHLTRLEITSNVDLEYLKDRLGAAAHVEDRMRLADALTQNSQSIQCLKDFLLMLESEDPTMYQIHRKATFPDLTLGSGRDALGPALRVFTANLVTVNIKGVFDGSLFWPTATEVSSSPTGVPHWPHLKVFIVTLCPTTPRGDYYFNMRPGSRWKHRCLPSDDKLQPLFDSWSRALECMPSLDKALLQFSVEMESYPEKAWENPRDEPETAVEDWGLGFEAAGQKSTSHLLWKQQVPGTAGKAVLMLRCVEGWRPWKSTMDRLLGLAGDIVVVEVDNWNKHRIL